MEQEVLLSFAVHQPELMALPSLDLLRLNHVKVLFRDPPYFYFDLAFGEPAIISSIFTLVRACLWP